MALYQMHNVQWRDRYQLRTEGLYEEVIMTYFRKFGSSFSWTCKTQSSLSPGRNWQWDLLNKICKFVNWCVYYSKIYLRKKSKSIMSLQISVAVGCLPSCDTTQRQFVITYRRFWTAYWSSLQGLRPTNYQQTSRNNQQEWRPQDIVYLPLSLPN
jgi:hypothetical protein